MNLSDLCPDGREKYAEFEKFAEAFRVHGRVQSFAMMHVKHQKFKDHLEECELCTQMEDGQDDSNV